MMRTIVLSLLVLGCGSKGDGSTTYTLHSTVDPQHPLDVHVTAQIPKDWPAPQLDKLGEPTFTFGHGIPALAISVTQVATAHDARGRIDQVDKDQLYPAGATRTDRSDGRRWIEVRENEPDGAIVDAQLLAAGPADSVVSCYLRGFKINREYVIARDVCEGLTVR